MCVAAIGLEDVAALQLAQPSLGKMAVKEPAQPFLALRADSHSEPSCLPAADSSVVLSQDIVHMVGLYNILIEHAG